MSTRVRYSGITGLYFAVCGAHGFRVDGVQDEVTRQAEDHDVLLHCHTHNCEEPLTLEDQCSEHPDLCTRCREQVGAEVVGEHKGDLEREGRVA